MGIDQRLPGKSVNCRACLQNSLWNYLVPSRRTAQNARRFTMGDKSTIPILQIIFALLALSECLPLSGGGSPESPSRPSRSARTTGEKQLDRMWIPQSLEHTGHLPANMPSNVEDSNEEQSDIMFPQSVLLNARGLELEDSNSNNKLKSRNPHEVLANEDRNVLRAGNGSEVTRKDNYHRAKRSYLELTLRDLDNLILSSLSRNLHPFSSNKLPCGSEWDDYCFNGGKCNYIPYLDKHKCW